MLSVKILGTGCARTRMMERKVRMAADQLDVIVHIIKIEEIDEIISYGISLIPSLLIDDHAVIVGRVPFISELKDLFIKYDRNPDTKLKTPA